MFVGKKGNWFNNGIDGFFFFRFGGVWKYDSKEEIYRFSFCFFERVKYKWFLGFKGGVRFILLFNGKDYTEMRSRVFFFLVGLRE